MSDRNEVILEGNLCRDVEIKYANSGTAIASLSVAYNDSYKKGNEYVKQSHFFDVTAFKDTALGCSGMTKGTLVHVEGKLAQDRWEKDGKTQYIDATDSAGKSYGSVVTPPALFLPADAMESCFVGADILQRGVEIHAMYKSWFGQKRLAPQIVEGEVLPALPAPKNVPQPVGDDELF